jgi:hypothetical protein
VAQSVHFAMQTYRKTDKGSLARARWTPCESAAEAIHRAETAVTVGKVAGAAALSQRCSGEFDEGELPITLAAFGEVPQEARDQLPF